MTTDPINIYEYEQVARERLPAAEYDFIAGGATDELTIRRTRQAFDSIMLRPRMLVDVAEIDPSTTVLGQNIEFPVMLDPSGNHGRAHAEGETATVRAAAAEGVVTVVSSSSTYTLEVIAEAATGPIWFQQYLFRDPGFTREMALRAQEAGYSVICLTLDSNVTPKRERNIRNDYQLATVPNYPGLDRNESGAISQFRTRSATWRELDQAMADIPLPVIVKGIMTGEDARLCAEHGVQGLVVSNHGARQLDTTFATIEVLPEIVEAVDGRCEVYLDGGIRRGADVMKAIALGARAVLVGRPVFWGLAVDGEAGLRSVLRILRDELTMTMAACGKRTLAELDGSVIGTVSPLLDAFTQPEGLRLPHV